MIRIGGQYYRVGIWSFVRRFVLRYLKEFSYFVELLEDSLFDIPILDNSNDELKLKFWHILHNTEYSAQPSRPEETRESNQCIS